MSTLVCFHAHPDDEVISTGGTIARAAAAIPAQSSVTYPRSKVNVSVKKKTDETPRDAANRSSRITLGALFVRTVRP